MVRLGFVWLGRVRLGWARLEKSMAPNEAVLVENAVSKLHYLQFICMRISTLLNEHF